MVPSETSMYGHLDKDTRVRKGFGYRSKLRGKPLYYVFQPQVPLRLPCYDFIPVAYMSLKRNFLTRVGINNILSI